MLKTTIRFLTDETGATAIEYGLIVAVLSLVVVGGVSQFADAMEYMFGNPDSALQQSLNK